MNTIDKLQNDLSDWYQTSSVGQFISWWTTQLKSFVPENYQEQWFSKPINVYLTQDDQEVTVWCRQGGDFEKYTGDKNEGKVEDAAPDGIQEEWWHQVQHIINQADGQKVVVEYLLAKKEALVKKIALPGAAKDNLDEVIGFELDKYVPFSSDQVQLSYKIDKDKSDDSKILMDLAVIPKQKIIDVLTMCDEKSISLDGIDVNLMGDAGDPVYLGVNLLPSDKRKAKDYFNLKLNVGLMILLLGLIYFVMHTSIANKQNKIDRLTNINSVLQKEARRSKLLKKELKSVIVSSKFLQTKKSNHPALVTLLSEVTSILPNTTYVTRLKINQDTLEITGQSDNANSLVPKLDQSTNWYVPQIGVITSDSRTKKEKFTIKAQLKEPQQEEENDKQSS